MIIARFTLFCQGLGVFDTEEYEYETKYQEEQEKQQEWYEARLVEFTQL